MYQSYLGKNTHAHAKQESKTDELITTANSVIRRNKIVTESSGKMRKNKSIN